MPDDTMRTGYLIYPMVSIFRVGGEVVEEYK